MIKYFKYIKYILLLGLVIILLIYINCSHKNVTIKDMDNLMIVVHKEDGLIWGGNELSKGNYLVVCVTCNDGDKDFIKIMKKMHNKYMLLDYGEETDFREEKYILKRDLERIINIKDWDKIITHNNEGEYGSDEHIIINNYVTNIVSDKNSLYYFNRYYIEEEFYDNSIDYYKLSDEEVDNKYKYLGYLDDLEYVLEFKHIIPFEEFVKWGDNNEE